MVLEAGIGLLALSQIGSGISQYQQGQANYRAANAQAQAIERANAVNERMRQEELQSLLSSQRAAAAASGVRLSGSPIQVMLESVEKYRKDAAMRSFNTTMEATQLRNQGRIYRSAGIASLVTNTVGAAGSAGIEYGRRKT